MNNFMSLTLCLTVSLVASFNTIDKRTTNYSSMNAESRLIYRVNYITDMLVAAGVPYVWGGYRLDRAVNWGRDKGKVGLDCSGAEVYKWRKAGAPFIRATSRAMWLGAWPGKNVLAKHGAFIKAENPDQIYLTYSAKRFAGHVMSVRANINGTKIIAAEASSSKKRYKETIIRKNDYRYNHMVGIKKLNLTPGF